MYHHKSRNQVANRLPLKTLALAVAIGVCLPFHAAAQQAEVGQEAVLEFDIPAGDLSAALERFSTQSGVQAMYRQELVTGKRTSAIRGALSPDAVLSRLLAGTGLVFEKVNEKTYAIKQGDAKKPSVATPDPRLKTKGTSESKSSQENVMSLDGLVVVGSRLGLSPYDTMSMAKVIEREEIERSGSSSVGEILANLPEVSLSNTGTSPTGAVGGSGLSGSSIGAATVQLRGLPMGTTLVLINGRRTSPSPALVVSGVDFFDLTTIPLSMVERIEVLPVGSSAVYGGDGLAGVINIVLRKNAGGLEVSYREQYASGLPERSATVTRGKAWGKSRIVASVTWMKKGALHRGERSITANQDYTRLGGQDRRSHYSYPANIYSLDGCELDLQLIGLCLTPLDQRGNLPGLASPYAGVPSGQNGSDLTPQDFISTAGTLNKYSAHGHLVSPSEQFGVTFDGAYELRDGMEVFAEWASTRRKVEQGQIPIVLISAEWGGEPISAANPYNPFGVDVSAAYQFYDTGIYQTYTQTFLRGLVGVRGSDESGGWELTAWRSREWSDTGDLGQFDNNLVALSLMSTDPALALNVFTGDGSAPGSRELLLSLISQKNDSYGISTQGANAFLRRDFNLSGRKGSVLVGGEYERTMLDWVPEDESYKQVKGDDSRRAAFAEARVPLVTRSVSPGNLLTASAAVRYEETGRAQGSAFTKAFGLEFRPSTSLAVHLNYSTAFKPLPLYAAAREPDQELFLVEDPKFDNQRYIAEFIRNGGAPEDLRPETGESRALTILYTPNENFRLSAMYWQTQIDNQIRTTTPRDIVLSEALLPNRVRRNSVTGLIEAVDARHINISSIESSGIDIGLEYSIYSQYGDLRGSINSSYIRRYTSQLTNDSPFVDGVARWNTGLYGWAPRWKIVPMLRWTWRDDVDLTMSGRYVSKYLDPLPLQDGRQQRLGGIWHADLNLDVRLPVSFESTRVRDMRVTLGAKNIFNRLPTYCNSCGSYDALQYDIIGRRAYVELRAAF